MERHHSPKPRPPPGTSPGRASEPRLATGTVESPPVPLDEREPRYDDIAQIVHDLRDPLATIALEAYVLDRKLASGDHSDVKCTTTRIIRNIEFLDGMIQDLLDACMIGESHFEIHRRPTELRALLEQVVDRVVSTDDHPRVVLDAPLRLTLRIDGTRIERVVANLIGNALKYTAKRGGVVVRLEAGALGALISVTDAGPGIDPEEMEHIFDKYRRGIEAHGVEGRGLGLYVSKTIVEAHGGRIGVDSVRGAGSRFYFDLPTIGT